MNEAEIEHIKKLYDRIDGIKDQMLDFSLQLGFLRESIKDNKIDDLINDSKLKKEIQSMAGKQGRRTTLKWGGGVIAIIEAIRQLMENL
jgi:hypothetical protein